MCTYWSFHLCCAPLPSDATTPLCTDLLLPMSWVNSPNMFCAASETVADMANGYLLDPTSTFVIYPPTVGTYATAPAPPASPSRLQCTEVCMGDLISATQGGISQQKQAAELTLRALEEIPPLSQIRSRILLVSERPCREKGAGPL